MIESAPSSSDARNILNIWREFGKINEVDGECAVVYDIRIHLIKMEHFKKQVKNQDIII